MREMIDNTEPRERTRAAAGARFAKAREVGEFVGFEELRNRT